MRKILLLAISLCFVTLAGCDKESEKEKTYDLVISGVGGDPVGSVREVYAYSIVYGSTIAKASLTNKSATLKLPEKVGAMYLVDIDESFPEEFFEVSDRSVQWTDLISLKGFDGDGSETGYFAQASRGANFLQYVRYAYSDGHTKVSAEGENNDGIPMEYDITLQAGWNRLAQKYYFEDLNAEELVPTKIVITTSLSSGILWYYFKE